MLLITSSRRPAARTRTFMKELERTIPGSKRIVRGKKSMEDLMHMMIQYGASNLIIVDTRKGNPAILKLYKLSHPHLKLVCNIYIKGLSLQVDVKKKTFFSELEIVDNCGNEVSSKLYRVLASFIPEQSMLMVRKGGVRGYLSIECDGEEGLVLAFKNAMNKYVYPVIRVERVEFFDAE